MQILESELEEMVYNDLTTNGGAGLARRGFETIHHRFLTRGDIHTCKWLRQVDLGMYGRIDIVGYFRRGGAIYVPLIELKVVPIDCSHIDQICRYKEGISRYFSNRFAIHFDLILVGTDVKDGHYIHNNIYNLKIIEFKYGLDGIEFDSHLGEWYRPGDDSFNPIKSLRHAEEIHGYR